MKASRVGRVWTGTLAVLALCVVGCESQPSRQINPIDLSGSARTLPGLVSDGITLNTLVIQRAIDECSASGGGKVRLPAGRYVTGTIRLKDNVTLTLEEGTTLLGSTRASDYRNVDPFTAGDGVPLGSALVVAVDAKNVGLEGAGTIDGQAKALAAGQKPYKVRPFLMRWVRCDGVRVAGLTLVAPGAWTNHLFQCRNVTIERLSVRSKTAGIPNTDGIDVDSCQGVRFDGCEIDSGDDAVCLKTTSKMPCSDISVSNCTLTTLCNAVKIGTESLGDFEQIRVKDCRVRHVGMAGIAVYCVDGAHADGLWFDKITMDGVNVAVSIRLGARLKTFRPGDYAKPVGTLRNISVSHIRARGIGRIRLLINGIPDHPVEQLALTDIQIECPGGGRDTDALIQLPEKISAYPEMDMFGAKMPAYGMYLRHVRGATLDRITFTTRRNDGRPSVLELDATGVCSTTANPVPAGQK